jgi:hypothetical protein
MAAPEGNQFWKMRSTHGRKPIFATPEDLATACEEYFEWVHANPLKEAQAFAYQGNVTVHELSKMRAMTLAGLCIFLDINRSSWNEYCAREGFSEVTARVDHVIRTQKFEGASAGLLNANIIARDLGLADQQQHTGAGGEKLIPEETSSRDLAKAIAALLAKGMKTE